MAAIKVEVRTQGGWHRFTATFPTPAQLIAYAEARRSSHIISELEEAPIPQTDENADLLAYLYPTCHHGLSAELCMDPIGDHHFGTREWEMAQYGG